MVRANHHLRGARRRLAHPASKRNRPSAAGMRTTPVRVRVPCSLHRPGRGGRFSRRYLPAPGKGHLSMAPWIVVVTVVAFVVHRAIEVPAAIGMKRMTTSPVAPCCGLGLQTSAYSRYLHALTSAPSSEIERNFDAYPQPSAGPSRAPAFNTAYRRCFAGASIEPAAPMAAGSKQQSENRSTDASTDS
jgi:hypothetical protein